MNFLEERILKDGIVKEGNVLKVDSFLNHQMDVKLFDEIGAEFKSRFDGVQVDIDGDVFVTEVESFTHKCKNQIMVSKKFLKPGENVLIIDDFLANGCALQGLISIVSSAGANVAGIGIVIEKGFQQGGQIIRNLGYHLESLAIVEEMNAETGDIRFRENK